MADLDYWIAPVLISIFILAMLSIGIILCCKLRKRKQSGSNRSDDCNCKPKTVKSRAKSFLSNTIFFTQSSERAVDGPLYKQCEKACRCKPQNCKYCRVPGEQPPPSKGILKNNGYNPA